MKEIREKVVKEVYVVTGEQVFCDECKKIIRSYNPSDNSKGYSYDHRIEWYEVTTGHSDWGNDSIDSIAHLDICPDCIEKVFGRYVERSKGRNTEYINIDHKWSYAREGESDGEDKLS